MSDEIIFKEDIKKKSVFGWLPFGKKKAAPSSSEPIASQPVSAVAASPVPLPIRLPRGNAPGNPFPGQGTHTSALFAQSGIQPRPKNEWEIPNPVVMPQGMPEQGVVFPPVQPEAVSEPDPALVPVAAPVEMLVEPSSSVAPAPFVPELYVQSESPKEALPQETAPAFSDPSAQETSFVQSSAPAYIQPAVEAAPSVQTPENTESAYASAPSESSPVRYEAAAWESPQSLTSSEALPISSEPVRPIESERVSFAPKPSAPSRTPKPAASKISESDLLYQKGIATLKDLIAPPAIRLTPNSMQVGEVTARTHFIIAYPKFLGTNWFSPIVNLDAPMDIAFFIHPIDTRDIVKDLRRSATQVQSQISMEAEDGKIRDPLLEAALENIEELRDKLQQGTEKFFRFGLYITIYAADEKGLDGLSQSIEAILEAQLVYTKPAVLRMDQGFVSTRPLAMDTLDIANNLNTGPLSTTFPFVSSDLSSNDGVLYGINRHNNSLVLFDRFKMENANMVVFAKSGAGKSYTIKLEVLRAMMFNTAVIIIDPENEYKHLCETVDGTFLNISLNSSSHLNPFDLPKLEKGGDADDDTGVFRSHVSNLIGLLHLMLGSVTPEEDSILDRAIRETYAIRDITENSNFRILTPASYPTMSDLYAVLENLEGAESLTARLERYTDGVFGGFLNHQTNILMDKQLVVFNIRDLENELRPVAMYIVLQFIWNEIRAQMKQRLIVVDEAWIMMQNDDAAAFLFGIAKRCRKYYTGLTTITQDIADFMSSRYGKPIVTNSSMQLLLKQSPASVDLIAETFYLTDHEKFLLLESNVGEGIFFAGTKHVAIKVIASYSEDQIITTDPRQLMEVEQAKKDFDEGK